MRVFVFIAWAAGWAAGLFAVTANAHPHVFIDAGVQMLFDDQGRLAAVRIVWAYDEFYSLLILEDCGLDPDADGVLTAEEQTLLAGFDMNWDPGFAGDTYLLQGDQPLELSGPTEFGAEFRNGRIISTHLRALPQRVEVGVEPVVIKTFDPTYYTAYAISFDPVVKGRTGCDAQIFRPDLTAVSAELQAALAELSPDQSIDELNLDSFPPIGEAFAEEVRVTCVPPA